MKTFKKLATLSMALLFTLGLGALAACEVEDTASSSPAASESAKAENCYVFTVLGADGNKVSGEGYTINLCTADNAMCHAQVAVVDGVCIYDVATITAPTELVVHVYKNYEELELKTPVTTNASAWGSYTLQLK